PAPAVALVHPLRGAARRIRVRAGPGERARTTQRRRPPGPAGRPRHGLRTPPGGTPRGGVTWRTPGGGREPHGPRQRPLLGPGRRGAVPRVRGEGGARGARPGGGGRGRPALFLPGARGPAHGAGR